MSFSIPSSPAVLSPPPCPGPLSLSLTVSFSFCSSLLLCSLCALILSVFFLFCHFPHHILIFCLTRFHHPCPLHLFWSAPTLSE